MFCLILSFMPNLIMKNANSAIYGIYINFKYNKIQIVLGLIISLVLYILTYRKPLKGKEEIINNLNNETENVDNPPFKFTWDGCSGGISALTNLFFTKVDWEDGNGCLKHDYAYWKGGTFTMKRNADNDLYNHIVSLGHSKIYAYIVWFAIAIGGLPFIPAPWRWGYGYPYPQKIFF